MTTRSRESVVHFSHAFSLSGFAEQPPGDYRVEHDEESLESGSRLAWRQTASFIHLPMIGAPNSLHQMVPIAPAELESMLEKDKRK